MENRQAWRAMRHLQRAQELLDSQGFGSEYKRNTMGENDFGGFIEWVTQLFKDPENQLSRLDDKLKKRILSDLDVKSIRKFRETSHDGRRVAGEHFTDEAKKRAKDPKALLTAVKEKDAIMVEQLLNLNVEIKADVLPKAVEKGNKKIVELLLDKGEDKNINATNEDRPQNILHFAIKGLRTGDPSSYEIAELLVERGADVNVDIKDLLGHVRSVFDILITEIGAWRDCDDFPFDKAISLVKLFLEKGALYWDTPFYIIDFHIKDVEEEGPSGKKDDYMKMYKEIRDLLEHYKPSF